MRFCSRSGTLIAEPAHVARRTTSNLVGSTDVAPGEASDHDESKSDFISKRRDPPAYTSSKSMMNLREMAAVGMHHDVLGAQLDRPPRKIRSRWGDPLPNWPREGELDEFSSATANSSSLELSHDCKFDHGRAEEQSQYLDFRAGLIL
ncbi:hypothetical protein OESDEN_02749 [Oesophagostomum dentatum]|uniref:Uncharacterized protein n=1 Tax=Oesophagostomum dentatum TaxID=61180 RepID=A0A0B1TJ42_OESDE|nr:hypothetical protein OESDEN_02749 [Oesophagostomum dentatum]